VRGGQGMNFMVSKCDNCPFLHGGLAERLRCMANIKTSYREKWEGPITRKDMIDTAPEWCPLKGEDIVVSMER